MLLSNCHPCIFFIVSYLFCTLPVFLDFCRRQLFDLHITIFPSPFLWDRSSNPEIAFPRNSAWVPSLKGIVCLEYGVSESPG